MNEEPTDSRVERLWQDYAESRSEVDRNRLVVHYAPLTKYVAGRLASTLPHHVDVNDLLSDGAIGLMTAVERYDPARSTDFAAFGIRRIRGAMIDGLRALDWLPRSVRAQVKELESCTQRLYAELGRPPTQEELSVELGVGTDEVSARRRRRDEARQVPLPPSDVVEAGAGAPIESRPSDAGDRSLPPVLMRELRRLPERDQVLVALYYYERLTMAQVGAVLGVSESRVSQLHQRIRQDLRDRLPTRAQGGGDLASGQ